MPGHTIALIPAFAVPAPTKPPISACELDDGIAAHQVMRFQEIAPISAPKITRQSTTSGAMSPVPMVCATCSPKNRKAMKLKKAAKATAISGESTRVDTTVAIEFAASCKPLRKSKISATAMSAMMMVSEPDIPGGPIRSQTCSMTMPWISSATSSSLSTARSR